MSEPQFDVVIVGGGIQGVGVAQAATAEGQSVLLLERSGLAHGTSSKSSKLIHGGLRYLESGQFSLVRECLRERSILLNIVPDLVTIKRFFIPVYKGMRRPSWQISLGLKIYSLLSGFRAESITGKVPKKDWHTLDGIETEGLQSVFYYSDAQTNDQLLTEAVMRSAQKLGAELCMPAEFIKSEVHSTGCKVFYCQNGQQKNCETRVLVNAAGPWISEVVDHISPSPYPQAVDLISGTHILVDGKIDKGIYYTESPRDGRAIFVMPWEGRLMIGTTERKYRGHPDDIGPTTTEIKYLLSVLGHYFPRFRSTRTADVLDAWAGLRVLPRGAGHAFHRSREVLYSVDDKRKPRVLSIYGGKLTAYRATAQEVMKRIRPTLVKRNRQGFTEQLSLNHADTKN